MCLSSRERLAASVAKIIWHYSWKMTQQDSADSQGAHWSAELMCRHRLCFCLVPAHRFHSNTLISFETPPPCGRWSFYQWKSFLLCSFPSSTGAVRFSPCWWQTLAGGMPANAGLLATPVLPQDTNLKPSSVHAKCFSSDHTKQA